MNIKKLKIELSESVIFDILYILKWIFKNKKIMAGQGKGQGEAGDKLAGQIACIKYTVFCFNIVCWVSHLNLLWFIMYIKCLKKLFQKPN